MTAEACSCVPNETFYFDLIYESTNVGGYSQLAHLDRVTVETKTCTHTGPSRTGIAHPCSSSTLL
uniref:Uncharacterized protein n=1 Tax=Anguilla anguilla TaxID=7936 RepID=A0A0E9XK41_ANGAN